MRKILVIAGLAVKLAVRSRLFIALMVIMLMAVTGLTLSIKGDGTLRGQIALFLYYSLGVSTIILGIATVWTSCWSISREVEEKSIQMIVVKPIHRFQIWFGKWLGILFINAILLAISAGITFAVVEFKISGPDIDPKAVAIVKSEVLVCRNRFVPDTEDMTREAHELVQSLKQQGEISESTPHDVAFELAYKRIAASRVAVAPGQSKKWVFNLKRGLRKSSKIAFRYHISDQARHRNPVSGSWTVGSAASPEVYTVSIANYLAGQHLLPVSAEMFDGENQLIVTFKNSDRNESNVAVFDMQNDIELLIEEGGFLGNYLRTVVILFCHLALLAGLGLMASALLTFPVAAFTVMSILVISLLSHYFTVTYGSESVHDCHDHGCGAPAQTSGVMHAMEKMIVRLNIVVDPAMKFQPMGLMTDGLLVSWMDTARAVFVLLVLYPALFGLAGALFLNRRELALPV